MTSWKTAPIAWRRMVPILTGAAVLAAGAVIPALGDDRAPQTLTVCPFDALTADCDYTSIAQAADAAGEGDTIVLRKGVYREAAFLNAARLTLRAEPGAHMQGVAVEEKAALVVRGDDTVIEGLECSRIAVSHGNGACVRAEGRNLTLRGVYFHHSQDGILGGRGRILIEDSRFEHLGGDRATRIGSAHGIYIGHRAEELILRRSMVLASKEEGHEVKSRAKRTIIEDNVIGSQDGVDSRQIDLPHGGEIVIRRNILQKGRRSTNPQFIAIGLERGNQPELDRDYETGPALIEDNIFIVDLRRPTYLVAVKDVARAQRTNNTVVGREPTDMGDSRRILTRKAAGLPPYPLLPAAPPF